MHPLDLEHLGGIYKEAMVQMEWLMYATKRKLSTAVNGGSCIFLFKNDHPSTIWSKEQLVKRKIT